MPEHIQQIKTIDGNGVATKTTRIVDDGAETATSEPYSRASTAARVVWFIADVVIALLAFRFALILLGANPANAFANLIYSISYPFAAPFFGLFGYSIRYGISRFETSTLVAMAVYALLAFAITRLLTIRRPDA